MEGMHGNVREWVADWYGVYPAEAVTDPEGPATGTERILRGGGIDDEPADCRSAARIRSPGGAATGTSGLRVVLVPVAGVPRNPDALYPPPEPWDRTSRGESYQWFRDGTPIEGATGASLEIPRVTSAEAGGYTVVVTAGGMSATSAVAVVRVRMESEVVGGVTWYYVTNAAGGATVTEVDPPAGDLAMPETLGGLAVTAVGEKAFDRCTNITGMAIASGVTNIGEAAFANCTGLTDLTLPDSVATLGEEAFALCASLTNVWLGTGVESVGTNSFLNCDALETIWVPVEKKDTGLLDAAALPDTCEVHWYGTQNVSFDGNGGTPEQAGMVAEIGGKYGALPGAARQGWGFLGWFDAAEGGAEVTADSAVTETAERTLHAHWEEGRNVWRFYSKAKKAHFFTVSEEEAASLAGNPNWAPDGDGWVAFANPVPGATVIHRFYSKKYGGHFYTADEEEMERVRDTNPNWKYEGIGYYAYPAEFPGTKPVYRFWSKKYCQHFFTIDEAEKDGLIAGNPNWTYEGIAFWAFLPEDLPAKGAGSRAAVLAASASAGISGGTGGSAAVTTSDGTDGAAVADGDETTGWSPETADGSWVVLSFAEVRDVADVEVVGENLPEGTRILLSENADDWTEEVPGTARYVWVAFPAAEEAPMVKEIRVEGE
jgi:hypothetical protein